MEFTDSQLASVLRNSMRAILAENRAVDEASIREGLTSPPSGKRTFALDLTTARLQTDPLRISVPIKSLYVETATDANVEIYYKMDTDAVDSDWTKLKLKDSQEFSRAKSSILLYWAAQSGKSITLNLYPDSVFRPGSSVTSAGGSVSTADGVSLTSNANVACPAGTATKVLDTDSTRVVETVQFSTSGWIGDSSASAVVGSQKGNYVAAFEKVAFRNTGILYFYPTVGAGDAVAYRNVEKN